MIKLDKLSKLVNRANWKTEMSDFGVLNGNKITFSNTKSDHGNMHFHYGSIKIFVPETLPKTNEELKSYVLPKYLSRITDKDLTSIRDWLNKKSTKKDLTNYTNLELLQLQKKIWEN